MSKFYVYVLQNKDGLLYKGVTSNLQKRIKEHNSKQSKIKWTNNKGPWNLVYSEEFESKPEALAREKFFKTGKGRSFIITCLLERTK